ncbi:MAG: ATP-binding protein [bacterium]|nr:ATP-binding protein [bacterium]
MITRDAEKKLLQLSRSFKAVAVIGPRQSGKTTLVKSLFKNKPYASLENPDIMRFALEDPRGFLGSFPNGAILDEAQRAPDLYSYLQEILDNSKKRGLFILTGSNNFLLQQSISQTLAGRIGYLQLLPFSVNELISGKKLPKNDDELLLKGSYPPIYHQRIPPGDWYPNYIRTYIERDVRQLKNISDLNRFTKFLSLLAGRCGQELNMNSLSIEVGADLKTMQSWIGILESSFIVYLLRPHFKNFNKTVIKRPKLYFYDTGLVCSLLRISSVKQLETHPLRGAIFEALVITEFVKQRSNAGQPNNLYYWRDKTGHEIDLLIDAASKLIPIEIKSGKTITPEFFRNLDYWCKLSSIKKSYLLYAGTEKQKRSAGTEILPWKELAQIKS